MDWENMTIGIYGVGLSGIASIKTLDNLNSKLILIDSKSKEELEKTLNLSEYKNIINIYNEDNLCIDKMDLLVKSPGIPLDTKVIKICNKKGIEIITDIELAYRIRTYENMIVVTGTNGKTSTTTLLNDILKNSGENVYLAGNIGIGIMDIVPETKKEDTLLIEASSFQLENIKKLRPKVGVFINFTPDHLDWHMNLENYFNAKKNLFIHQRKEDWAILNYDNSKISSIKEDIESRVIYFSTKDVLEEGVFIKGDKIYSRINNIEEYYGDVSEYKLIDENILAAIGASIAYGISNDIIRESLRKFKPLEHRMEYVSEKNKVKFYNDSKGTNPDSTIKAIQSIKGSKVLIAGGYDKGSSYEKLMETIKEDVKYLILMGETSEKIKETGEKLGYYNTFIVRDMKEAVLRAYELSKPGDTILLSPACASWGMYKNYEERGRDFKEEVEKLR